MEIMKFEVEKFLEDLKKRTVILIKKITLSDLTLSGIFKSSVLIIFIYELMVLSREKLGISNGVIDVARAIKSMANGYIGMCILAFLCLFILEGLYATYLVTTKFISDVEYRKKTINLIKNSVLALCAGVLVVFAMFVGLVLIEFISRMIRNCKIG